jgi:hypothetical protein
MILNVQVIKEYEDWLREFLDEEEISSMEQKAPSLYHHLFMDYMETQLNGGK